MRSARTTGLALTAFLGMAVSGVASAGALPPAGTRPLSAIIKSVEERGSGTITSAAFDESFWEVKVRTGYSGTILYLDPMTGDERRRKAEDPDDEAPPAGAKPLSETIGALEQRGMGVITEVQFDDRFWEVELRQDGRKRKIDIDPRTGGQRRR
jgi:hypothetical protein